MQSNKTRATTVLVVRAGGKVVMGSDGQVTMGNTVLKHNARKIRRMYSDKVLGGFAGATADAFTLFERLEAKLGQLSPLRILERGYAIVSNREGIVKDAASAQPGSRIHARLAKGELDAVVE